MHPGAHDLALRLPKATRNPGHRRAQNRDAPRSIKAGPRATVSRHTKSRSRQDGAGVDGWSARPIRGPTLVMKADGTIASFNRHCQQLLALPANQIAGRRLREFIDDPDRANFELLLRLTRIAGAAEGRATLVSATGGRWPLHWQAHAVPHADGKLVCLMGWSPAESEIARPTRASLDAQLREQSVVIQELQDSVQRYADLSDEAPMGSLNLDNGGCIVTANQAALRLLGAAHRTRHLIRTPLLAFVVQPDRRKLLNHFRLCRERRERISTELELNFPSETDPAFVELISVPFTDPVTNKEGFKSLILDITGRKRTEARAAEHEAQSRFVADLTPVLFTRCDREMRYRFVNRACAEFLGLRAEDIVGKSVRVVMGEAAFKTIAPYIEKVLQGEQVEFETEIPYPSGRRYMHVVYTPERDRQGRVQGWVSVISDFTERKRMESALELASRLPQENPAPVLRLDQTQIVTFANPSADVVLKRWGVTVGERAPQRIARLARKALAKNEKLAHEMTVGRQSFQIWFVPVRESGYANLYFSEITQRRRAEKELRRAHNELEDRVRRRTSQLMRANKLLLKQMAARKRVERELRQSEERHRLIIEGARDHAIFMLDREGRVATWNSGAHAISGYRPKEIIGRHFSRFHPRESILKGKPRWLLETARTTGRVEDEGWRIRKDGTQFWANVIITALYDSSGHLSGFLNVTRDNTERRRAQEALRSNAEKMEEFFEQSPFGLFWVGPKGRILRANKAGLELLGCTAGKCLDRRVHEFHADPETVAPLLKRLARREVVHSHRARIRREDGSLRHVLVDASGSWENGRLVHSRWHVRDITRQVELEREILAIAERERQRLGRDLHDDLCQQLTGIEFLSQTLAGKLSANSPEAAGRVREITGMIRQAINHTRELAHGLVPVELEASGLVGALQELAERTRRMFGIACRFKCRKTDLNLKPTVSIHLYRIAQECIANAIKHGKASRVELGLSQNNGRLMLGVKDNGLGMPVNPRKWKGMGIRVMQYRAGVIAGTLVFQRNAAGGNTVVCSVRDALSKAKPKPIL